MYRISMSYNSLIIAVKYEWATNQIRKKYFYSNIAYYFYVYGVYTVPIVHCFQRSKVSLQMRIVREQ